MSRRQYLEHSSPLNHWKAQQSYTCKECLRTLLVSLGASWEKSVLQHLFWLHSYLTLVFQSWTSCNYYITNSLAVHTYSSGRFAACTLQWNVNGLHSRFSLLCLRPQDSYFDVIAFQETRLGDDQCRISG